MLSAGAAYLLAFQPSSLVTQLIKRALTERVSATIDPKLKHAVELARKALSIEDRMVGTAISKLEAKAEKAGFNMPASPTSVDGVDAWARAIAGSVRAALADHVAELAFTAGEAARDLQVAVGVAAHVVYLRTASPENPELRAEAEAQAAALTAALDQLEQIVTRTNRPEVTRIAGTIRGYVGAAPDFATAVSDERYKAVNEWAGKLPGVLEALARAFDAKAPAQPQAQPQAPAQPDAREQALLESIIANPDYDPPRLELAELGAARNDPRAELIREQFAGRDKRAAGRRADEAPHLGRARQLVTAHPEWTAPITALGARDVQFERGFPEEITISAVDFLAHGAELLMLAPVTRVKIRDAAGKLGELIAAPVMARVAGLDLAEQGVTDDDVIALAASPAANRLRFLDLSRNRITARGIEALASSSQLRNLERVNLDANPGGDPSDAFEDHDETNRHRIPSEAGKTLEAKYGPLRWLHPPDRE